MDFLQSLIHDAVIRASASTYAPQELGNRGLQITLNTSANKNKRFVGPETNPVYPDLIIWRPDFPGSNLGQVVVVEAIETTFTLNTPQLFKWRMLASLGVRFNLIIPVTSLQNVRSALISNGLTNGVVLQTYAIDSQNRYTFTTVSIT